jgi:hypothetical protein
MDMNRESGSAAQKGKQKSARHQSVPRHGISKQAVMPPLSFVQPCSPLQNSIQTHLVMQDCLLSSGSLLKGL